MSWGRRTKGELGGSLQVESTLGEGTAVSVELPFCLEAGLPGVRGGGR